MHLSNNYHLKLSDIPRICFYCGEPATDREHVFPRSVFGERGFKVWACRECNGIAGARVFDTVDEKAEFIRRRLEKKHRKALSFPNWTKDELLEIRYRLRNTILKKMEKKEWIKRRIAWQTTVNALIAKKYLENEGIGRDSVLDDAEKYGIKNSDLLLLIELD